MNEDLALILSITCLSCANSLTELFPLMVEHNPSWSNDDNRFILAGIISQILEFLEKSVYEDYPNIKIDMERRMKIYERNF